MGTFILRPVSVSSANIGWETIIASVPNFTPTDPELIEAAISELDPIDDTGLRVTSFPPGTGEIGFGCLGLGLYLDGSPTPIDTNNLPPGFTVDSAHFIAQSKFNVPGVGKQITYTRDGFTIHVSSATESVDVDLGPLTNIGLTTSLLGVDGETSDGSNIGSNNIGIEGIYSTNTGITLNPAAGSVEPGQSIAVSGPGVGGLDYAAVIGDKIVPIIPKIIGPDDVIIEVPSPNPACDDCFDDCPECDECFDACNEDLTGEACQACLDACLTCLTDCLEDLELAEACQESVDDPQDPTPITIICGTPGNEFTGSVPLGNFNILVARASGIYQLVDGKSEDTLYATARDGTTYDVKIPNPNGKTGFFRS